jgi:ABC-type antimicrobial peptide transport system permease subunit
VIVSETAARMAWPNDDAIGKVWNIENAQRTVVGVVKDSGANLLIDANSIEAYVPIPDNRLDTAALIVHTRGGIAQVVRGIPLLSDSVNRQMAAVSMKAARENIFDSQRKTITVLGALGFLATILAAAGMFAMVAFAVAQQRRELGIRMAIGARSPDILKMLLGRNLLPIAIGTVAGALLGVAVGRVTASIVQIVQDPLDPRGFALGLAAFALVAILATLAPALKALRIDPSVTLRYE